MKIAIGSDHAGFAYKEKLKAFLIEEGNDIADLGTHSEAPVDYPVFIRPVAEAVARGEFHPTGVRDCEWFPRGPSRTPRLKKGERHLTRRFPHRKPPHGR